MADDRGFPRERVVARGEPARRGAWRDEAVLALSALGAANMSLVSLRQLGLIAHLPDPPIRGFDADRVTADRAARLFGVPDAPFEALNLLANLPLARLAASDVGETHPWIPLLLGAKTLTEAGIAVWYFEHMRRRVGVWCAYCIAEAVINVSLAALTLPRTRRAAARAGPGTVAVVAAVALAGVLFWRAGRGRGERG